MVPFSDIPNHRREVCSPPFSRPLPLPIACPTAFQRGKDARRLAGALLAITSNRIKAAAMSWIICGSTAVASSMWRAFGRTRVAWRTAVRMCPVHDRMRSLRAYGRRMRSCGVAQ